MFALVTGQGDRCVCLGFSSMVYLSFPLLSHSLLLCLVFWFTVLCIKTHSSALLFERTMCIALSSSSVSITCCLASFQCELCNRFDPVQLGGGLCFAPCFSVWVGAPGLLTSPVCSALELIQHITAPWLRRGWKHLHCGSRSMAHCHPGLVAL